MSRIGVTGGTGELGRAVVGRLVSLGYEVRATHLTSDPTVPEVEWVRCDITADEDVTAFTTGLDAVVHTAYDKTPGERQRTVIIDGTRHVAEACRQSGARLIHVSTDVVFDGRLDRAYVERDDLTPLTPYGQAKADAERVVTDVDPAAPVVRTSLLYSDAPTCHQMALVQRALTPGSDIEFYTDEYRCPAHVDDVARVLVELIDTDHPGPLHAGGDDRISRLEFAELLANAADLDSDDLRGRPMGADAETRPADLTLNSSACHALLGHAPRGARGVLA